ncbi:MAG: MATE family efflux transporter [Pseudomonadales bacterium]|nr:MATE family efflux transporter [Pseudomonadales bacterium]
MAAQLAQMGMGVVDTVMAGRFSAVDLAGVAIGGAVLWPCMMLMMGFLQAVTPTVAQLKGSGREAEVGEVIRQALWIAALASILIVWLLKNANYYYAAMQVDPEAVTIALAYLQAAAWGIPAIMGYFVLRFLAEGMGFTKPAMLIASLALLLKIPLNTIFVYGHFGLPVMGGVGCGFATAIVMWFQLILMICIVSRRRFQNVGWYSHFSWPKLPLIKKLLIIGIPIGATLFFEIGLFTFITVLLGRYGADVVASHSIAMSIGGISFMLPLAIGIAASIRIGLNVGAERYTDARLSAKVAMVSTLVVALASIAVVVLGRKWLAGLYTAETEVLNLAATLMLFVAVFQLFDNCQATAIGVLRGYKDTRVPMIFTLVGYWVFGLPIALCLGFGWLGQPLGVYGFWIGLILALVFVAIFSVARLYWLSNNINHIQLLAKY